MFKKLLLALALVVPVAAQTTYHYPAEETSNIFTNTNKFNRGVWTPAVTVAQLPACGSGVGVGQYHSVSDASSATIGATVVGGGNNSVSVFCNGQNWIITSGTSATFSGTVAASQAALTANTPFATVFDWGDSLSEGNQDGGGVTICTALTSLIPGLTCYNEGVGGQTSTQIAVREGAVSTTVTVVGGTIPASGGVTVTFTSGYEPAYNVTSGVSLPGCAMGVLGTIGGVQGCTVDNGSHVYTFTRSTSGSATPFTSGAWTPVNPTVPSGSLLIFEAGRNNFSNPTQVMSDLTAMVGSVPGGSQYIVMTVLTGNDDGMYEVLANYNTIVNTLNQQIQAAWPNNTFAWNRFLVANYNAAFPTDVYAHLDDKVPPSMRASIGTGTLTAAITSTTATSFTISGTTAPGNSLLIDNEEIYISSVSGGSVTNCVRGFNQTTAATHANGAAYTQKDPIHLSGTYYTLTATGLYQMIQQMPIPNLAATTTNLKAAQNDFTAPAQSRAVSAGDVNIAWGRIGGVNADLIALAATGPQRNLVPDSGLQLGSTLWTLSGQTITPASSNPYPGGSFGNVLTVTGTGSASGYQNASSAQIPVVGGKYYTLSAYENTTAVSSSFVTVSVYDVTNAAYLAYIFGMPGNANTANCPFYTNRQCLTFYVPSTTHTLQIIVTSNNAVIANGGVVVIGDIQLEQGMRATAYKLNLASDNVGLGVTPVASGTVFGSYTDAPSYYYYETGATTDYQQNLIFRDHTGTARIQFAVNAKASGGSVALSDLVDGSSKFGWSTGGSTYIRGQGASGSIDLYSGNSYRFWNSGGSSVVFNIDNFGNVIGGTLTAQGNATSVSTGQIQYSGQTTAASSCGSLTGAAGCIVVNIAGTNHYVPYW